MRLSAVLRRWFRAVDVPSTKPQIYAYKPKAKPKEFEPFAKSDSKRIEKAWAHGDAQPVPVEEDGMLSVDLNKMLCAPTYWDGPAYEVRRAAWFEIVGNNRVLPLDPETDRLVEEQWHNKVTSFELDIDGGLVGEFSGEKLALRAKEGWLSAFRRRILYRGIPKWRDEVRKDGAADERLAENVRIRPEYRRRKIDHLVFCVHGIGQLLSVKFEQVNFTNNVNDLRKMLNKDDEHIQVLPVLWRSLLDNKIHGIYPDQIFGSSNLAAEAVLDFVMYSSDVQRRRIQEIAANEMHTMLAKFCEMHPDFASNPRISIIGHSLGGVLSFDLVSEARLDFPVENLFLLGSPLGILKLIEDSTIEKLPAALYNIMRLSDPIATRIEPLVSHKALDIMPQRLPGKGTDLLDQAREFTGGLLEQGEFFASKASSVFGLIASEASKPVLPKTKSKEDVVIPELAKYNRHGRIDFSVKETLDISLLLGIAGHLMYLDSPEVVLFILNEIRKTSYGENRLDK